MKDQLLLCIKGKPLVGLEKGKVYTLHSHEKHCSGGPAGVTVAEIPYKNPHHRICGWCGGVEFRTHVGFLASRFIPLNDPDAKLEEREKELVLVR